MKNNLINTILMLFCSLFLFSCNLEEFPPASLSGEDYWTSEDNVKMMSYGFYTTAFPGAGTSWTFNNNRNNVSYAIINDDLTNETPRFWGTQIPSATSFRTNERTVSWSNFYAYVRKANLMLENVSEVPMDDSRKKYWTGMAKFWRAYMHYIMLVEYGDIPYIDTVAGPKDYDLVYTPRENRQSVMYKIKADIEAALASVDNVQEEANKTINRNVILALASRMFLFEGTWEKYHDDGAAAGYNEFLKFAKDCANELMATGAYQIAGSYRDLCSSENLEDNPEMILYREYYDDGEMTITHSAMTYASGYEDQKAGPSRSLIESYLCSDGLPIGVSSEYLGDRDIANFGKNRDPRMLQTMDDSVSLEGIDASFSNSGVMWCKYRNDKMLGTNEGTGINNVTDIPCVRYAEVLLNYAEACAELGTLTQADIDVSINVLRDRETVKLPHLQVLGNSPAVGGASYDDPERDSDVPSLIWEIRRERRVELVDEENFRYDDLRRWKKLHYADQTLNPKSNQGIYISKSDYPKLASNVILSEGDEGYIIGCSEANMRKLPGADGAGVIKEYLAPIGYSDIVDYRNRGYELYQNPGWPESN